MKNRLFSIFVVAAMLLLNMTIAYADTEFEGEGTAENPYLISSSSDLTKLAELTNTTATAEAYADKYYKLTADLDMSGITYKPISFATNMYTPQGKMFEGTFDGDGHIIKNVNIPSSVVPAYGCTAGIIGYLGGTVKNLGVENMTVTGGATQRLCIGGIAGSLANNVVIDSCYVRGMNVTATTSNQPTYAGGIAGRTISPPGIIKNCYATNLDFDGVAYANHKAGIIGGCGNTGYKAENCYTSYPKIQGNAAAKSSYMGTVNCHSFLSPEGVTASTLGEAFKDNSTVKNDGFPVLQWESTEGYKPIGERDDPYFTGKGTEETPFEIDSPEKLNKLAELTNNASTASYADKYYKLTADLDMSGITYKPISFATNMYTPQGKMFEGTFDGDGHIIKNVNIPSSVVPAYGCTAGIIGYLGGTVKNLGVENMTVTGGAVDRLCIGGIAGSIFDATIDCCYTKVMDVTSTAATPYVGGIAGRTIGSAGTITNCYSTSLTYTLSTPKCSAGILGSCGNTGNSAANCYTTHAKTQGDTSAQNSYMRTTNCYVNVSVDNNPGVSALGDSFIEDDDLINDGMPILSWEYNTAHPETAMFTAMIDDKDVEGRDDIKKDSTLVIKFDREMNTDTFSLICMYKNDVLLGNEDYKLEAVTNSQIEIKFTNADYSDKYSVFVPKTVQSVKGDDNKSAKADEKWIKFRIEALPKAIKVGNIKVNGSESWEPDFKIGEEITVTADVENISNNSSQSVALVTTLFSNGIMKYAALDTDVLTNSEKTLEVKFKVPENITIDSTTTLNVMVLDSISTMNAMEQIKTFK